ncbi:cysteine hydrolase, partial [Acidimicrobiaceae bacterium USS-CC1]|nr:cysteine hydrolase [Acidiferrimicrobium australe]
MTVTARDWLVAVDPQRVFADPASEWRAPHFAEVVAPIRALAAAHG